jgi:hypothetical protein
MDWKHLAPYIVPLVIVAFLARRLIRNAPQKVRVNLLFLRPLLIAVAVVAALSASPFPQLFWIVGFAVALAAGAGVGFLMTHHQEFSIDYDTGVVTSQATQIGTMLFVALFVVRFGLKYFMNGGNLYAAPPAHPGADVIGWTDAGLLFSAGFVFARAATTWLRARPLIAEHKARKLAAAPSEPPPGNP